LYRRASCGRRSTHPIVVVAKKSVVFRFSFSTQIPMILLAVCFPLV
jgi:hypothetical protein